VDDDAAGIESDCSREPRRKMKVQRPSPDTTTTAIQPLEEKNRFRERLKRRYQKSLWGPLRVPSSGGDFNDAPGGETHWEKRGSKTL